VRRALAVVVLAALAACSDKGGSTESLCTAVGQVDGLASALQGFDPTDPQAALDQLRPVRVILGDLRGEAPDEVRDELQVEIDYVQALIDALEGVPEGDPTAAALQVQAVTDAHPGVQQAADSLAAFTERECAPAGGTTGST
jgi:hypothetical protein